MDDQTTARVQAAIGRVAERFDQREMPVPASPPRDWGEHGSIAALEGDDLTDFWSAVRQELRDEGLPLGALEEASA